MADTNETIADIITEMRHKDTARRRFTLTDAFGGYETITIDRANTMLSLADRLEAANKRERGDCAKLREVVDAMMYEAFALCDSCVKPAAERGKLLAKWCNMLRAALAATEKEGGAK